MKSKKLRKKEYKKKGRTSPLYSEYIFSVLSSVYRPLTKEGESLFFAVCELPSRVTDGIYRVLEIFIPFTYIIRYEAFI